MDSNNKFWISLWSALIFAFVSIVALAAIDGINNNNLIAKQTTCSGKILQQSWSGEASEILALQACSGY